MISYCIKLYHISYIYIYKLNTISLRKTPGPAAPRALGAAGAAGGTALAAPGALRGAAEPQGGAAGVAAAGHLGTGGSTEKRRGKRGKSQGVDGFTWKNVGKTMENWGNM